MALIGSDEASRLRLLTLGAVAVRRGDGEELAAVAARPKEVALLAYLAVAGRRGPVRRDDLLARLWPELDERRARGALSQAIYRLRVSAGEDVIVTRGKDEVALGPGCACDAAAFLAEIERGERVRAIELYGGEFLPGFHVPGAYGFEEWSQAERDRLRSLAADALFRLAEEAEARADLAAAARWLRRHVETAPADEVALRRWMTILDRMGDRAGAARAYEEFTRRLAQTYELEPAPETAALLERIRTREAPATVELPPTFAESTDPPAAHSLEEGRRGPIRRPTRRAAILGGLLAALGIATTGWLVSGTPGLPSRTDSFQRGSRVIVAEVENRTDRPDLALAIRDAIATDLDQSGYINVVEPAELHDVLARMRRADAQAIGEKVALEIARREGYAAVLTASVVQLGTGYQIGARVLEAATGAAIARERETAASETEVLAAVERLSRRLRRRLGESGRDVRDSPPLPEVTTASLDALTLLARAGEYARRAEWRQAITLAEGAVELDTTFASAYLALSAWYSNVADPLMARRHAELARRHAERLPERERLRATARHHARQGRKDSVVHYLRLIVDRDPANAGALVELGNAYAGMDRRGEALGVYRRALELAPDYVTTHNKVMVTARTLGYDAEADSVLSRMRERFPDALVTRIGEVARAIHLRDLEGAGELAAAMASHASSEVRIWGRSLQLFLSGLRGQFGSGLERADSLTADASRIYGAEAAPALLRWIEYAALAAGAPERALPAGERAERALMNGGGGGGGSVVGLAVVANGYALAGREREAARVLAYVDSTLEADDRQSGIGDEVRAVLALRDDRPEDAEGWAGRARAANVGSLSPIGQLAVADAYAALGRQEDAAAAYEDLLKIVPTYDYSTFYLGPMWPLVHERLGGTYEALADTAAASRHLSAFVDLWRDGDPELRPRVDAARRAIQRLRSENGRD